MGTPNALWSILTESMAVAGRESGLAEVITRSTWWILGGSSGFISAGSGISSFE